MSNLAFDRSSSALETAFGRHRTRTVVYLLPPRRPSHRYSWLSGFVCGLTVAAVAVAVGMLLA